jgi:hypothetical protein
MGTELVRIPASIEPLPMPAAAIAALQWTPNAEFAADPNCSVQEPGGGDTASLRSRPDSVVVQRNVLWAEPQR